MGILYYTIPKAIFYLLKWDWTEVVQKSWETGLLQLQALILEPVGAGGMEFSDCCHGLRIFG